MGARGPLVVGSFVRSSRGPQSLTQPGDKFSRLTAVKRLGVDKYGNPVWRFQCACGNETDGVLKQVKYGKKKSCGCHRVAVAIEHGKKNATHGCARHGKLSPEYQSWKAMIARCENPHNASFKTYGGRGIRVEEPFRSSFEAFLSAVGPRPEGHSIDRIDNDGNYAPGNVRWATASEQAANRRRKQKC